jgi:hypothetical protein
MFKQRSIILLWIRTLRISRTRERKNNTEGDKNEKYEKPKGSNYPVCP